MGMSTHVVGFKPPDEKWQRMKAVRDACIAARVEIPVEVNDYFGYLSPDLAGVEVAEHELRNSGAVKDWQGDMSEGIEVDITKLGKDVTVLRFTNSW